MVYLPGEMRHGRRLQGSIVELGCRFLTKSDMPASPAAGMLEPLQQAIAELLAKQQTAALPGHERRQHPRVTYTERVEIVTPSATLAGFARDLSKGGLSFITTAPLAQEITVVLLPRDKGPTLRV